MFGHRNFITVLPKLWHPCHILSECKSCPRLERTLTMDTLSECMTWASSSPLHIERRAMLIHVTEDPQ